MKILALDLGKFKTVACIYRRNPDTRDVHEFTTVCDIRCLIWKRRTKRWQIVFSLSSLIPQVGEHGYRGC
jgi:hypothetical protein